MTVVGAVLLKEVRRLDLNSQELGVPVARLMERAGRALAEEVVRRRRGEEVVLLCGKGNNGGDGLAAATFLERHGVPYTVVLLEAPAGPGRSFLAKLPEERINFWKGARRSAWLGALVVDCMLGSGIRGRPRPPYDAAIRWLLRHDGTIVSCDVPSGLGTGLAVRPHATVTFHDIKDGMTKQNSGDVRVASIGIPKRAQTHVGIGDLHVGFVVPRRESHKGQNGRVLVVGGGPFTGAPYYTGMAAMRAGADLVHLATVADAADVVRGWGPDLIVHSLGPGGYLAPVHVDAAAALLDRVDTLAIGPGLGTQESTREAARMLMAAAGEAGKTIVVDADGLDAVDEDLLAQHGKQMVLTPHGGEFQDLTRWKPTKANVARYARQHDVCVLRKGAEDVISDGTAARVCGRGHPAMTVGGTGDVLTGVVAALLSKGAPPFDAACAAAYLNGCAGEVAADLRSYGITATDVHEALPAVLRRLES